MDSMLLLGIGIGFAIGVAIAVLTVWLKNTGLPKPRARDSFRPPPVPPRLPAAGTPRPSDGAAYPLPAKRSSTEWSVGIGGLKASFGVSTSVQKHSVVFPDEVLSLVREGRLEEAATRLSALRDLPEGEAKEMIALFRKFEAKGLGGQGSVAVSSEIRFRMPDKGEVEVSKAVQDLLREGRLDEASAQFDRETGIGPETARSLLEALPAAIRRPFSGV